MKITRRISLYIGLGIPFLLFLAHGSYYLGWTIDDPYISYRYAENLANGAGLVFNSGEYVEGYSNFLFTIILAACYTIGISPVWLSRIIGFIAAMIVFAVVFQQLNRESPVKSSPPLVRFVPLYFLALNGSVAFWAVSGLETGFFMLLVTLAWIALIREDHDSLSPWLVSLIFLGVALSRPEGILFFVICFLADCIRFIISGNKNYLWRLILRSIPIGLGFVAYNIWRVSYYHDLLPNTFYAKATGDAISRLMAGIWYSVRYVLFNGNVVFVVIPLIIFTSHIKRLSIQRSFEFVIAGSIFVIYAGGDWMPMWRFFVPIMPIIFYLTAQGLAVFWEAISASDTAYRRRDAVMIIVILTIALGLWHERRISYPIMASVREGTFYRPNILAGLWLKENASSQDLVAGEEAGIIPYYSGHTFIDMIGIVDKHISHVPGALHEKSDPDYVLGRNPDYIVLICAFAPESPDSFEALYTSGKELMQCEAFQNSYSPLASFARGNDLIGRNTLVIFKKQ